MSALGFELTSGQPHSNSVAEGREGSTWGCFWKEEEWVQDRQKQQTPQEPVPRLSRAQAMAERPTGTASLEQLV